jgi:hypothetical protein
VGQYVLFLVLDLSLYVGVLGLQGTDSGPQAHLRRGCEPTGGANTSFPHSAFLKLDLDKHLSRSLTVQGPKKISLKKRLAHRVAPLGGVVRSLEMHNGPLGAVTEIWERPPPTQKMLTAGPLGGGAGGPGAPNINTKNVDDGPSGIGAKDPGASTINAKNVDGGPPWGAVSEVRERPSST